MCVFVPVCAYSICQNGRVGSVIYRLLLIFFFFVQLSSSCFFRTIFIPFNLTCVMQCFLEKIHSQQHGNQDGFYHSVDRVGFFRKRILFIGFAHY